jgi:hypothetical protein
LHPDLSLDTSFNGTGYRVDNLLGEDDGRSVSPCSSIRRSSGGCAQDNGKFYFAFVRYNRDGSLDTSFNGSGGLSSTSAARSNDDELRGLAIQPDGRSSASALRRREAGKSPSFGC